MEKELKEKLIVMSNFNKVLLKKNKLLEDRANRYDKMVKKLKSRNNKALRLLSKGDLENAIDILKGDYDEYRRRNRNYNGHIK